MKQSTFFTLLLAPFILAAAAGTQAQIDLQNRLSQCAEIGNVQERLACYDELSNGDSAAPEQQPAPAPRTPVVVRPQPAQPARPVVETTPEVVEEENEISTFGQEQQPEPAQARVETTDTGEQALVDTVTEIKPLDSTRVLITLASGQVWRQTVGKRYMLREGDTVHITPSGWGKEYRLTADGKRGYIQVSRAR